MTLHWRRKTLSLLACLECFTPVGVSASSSAEAGVRHQPCSACSAGKQEQVPDLPLAAKPHGGTPRCVLVSLAPLPAWLSLCCCGRAPVGWPLVTRSHCWAFLISHDPFVFPTVCALTSVFLKTFYFGFAATVRAWRILK